MQVLNREYLSRKYGINRLNELTEIDLSNSQITKIDSNTFKNLAKLETLSLSFNAIEEIDMKLFENSSNLKHLKLFNNKLKRIDSNTFEKLTKLEVLWLSNNTIEEIDARSFENLSNLKVLYLFNNRLKRIDPNTFKNLTELEELSLGNNEIEEIDVRLFEGLLNLKVLSLSNNKLKVLSFAKSSASTQRYFNKENLTKYGFLSDWDEFLQQFSQLGNRRIEDKRNENLMNDLNKSELISSNQSTNKDKKIKDPYIGKLINERFEVVRKLGKGSFGLVYLVDDIKIDAKRIKQKAMKIMDELDSATENELDMFFEISHENILRYFDHFHLKMGDENQTFLITEYCENDDLAKKITEAKCFGSEFNETQILEWMRQATNALKYLHSRKPEPIIHRDIKPANMLLTARDEIKLADLGLSKLMDRSHASSYAGTPAYMSPEVFKAQFMETSYYPNTDVWSLGSVLYELLFLEYAFPQGQRGDPPIPSNLSRSGLFSSVLSKMLEKDCLTRITSRQLMGELENLCNDS